MGGDPGGGRMSALLCLLAGALLCNSIPHLAAGLRGEAFPTPFAQPPGKGLSRPEVNFLWGAANLFAGLLIAWRWLVTADFNAGLATLVLGFVAAGVPMSFHFGKVRRARGDAEPF